MSEITEAPAPPRTGYQDLGRISNPATIAVVGVSDESAFAAGTRATLEESGAELFFVHPKYDKVFGRKAYDSLGEIGQPVDVVFSATSAPRLVDTAIEGAEMGIGGIVTLAAGFAEIGEQGVELQRQLDAAAARGGFPLVGPNGIGMINVQAGNWLTMLPRWPARPGGLSAVAHSGGTIEAIGSASARPGGPGLNLLFSAGNEPITDLADYVNLLADDEHTKAILLVLEKIRRPEEFFAAAARALENDKPIVAVKLGRSERAQRLAASHTGAIVGDTWTYDVAFRQAGIQLAYDIDEAVDRVQLLERLPRKKWIPVKGLAVLTATGGFAQMAADLAEIEDVDIPELADLEPFVKENIPGGDAANPLDATVFGVSTPGLWERIVSEYEANDEVDAIVYPSQHADWDTAGPRSAEPFAEIAAKSDKVFVIAPVAGRPGAWLEKYEEQGVVVSNGPRSFMRGFHTLGAFVRTRKDARVAAASAIEPIPAPDGPRHSIAEGTMLGFAATMEMIQNAGIAVAPYTIMARPDDPLPEFAGPYVVKLADVAHRTEHNAVRVGVARDDIPTTISLLQTIAAKDGLPSTIAVQAMVKGHGEAFIGIKGSSELGPVVVFGLGGIFVEVFKRVGGRIAPFAEKDAAELIAEFDDLGVLDGHRGAKPWDRAKLAETLLAASRLAAAGREWIDSIDLNPLIVTDDGPVAVDGLCLLTEQA